MKRLINRLTSLVLILSLSICIFPNAVIPAHAASASVWYTLHVQDIGWMKSSHDGETNGTTGKSLRAEAVQMDLGLSGITGGITYQSHLQDIGWTSWVNNRTTSGTTGQSRRMEAIRAKLTGNIANSYDLYYRVHVQDIGWMDWVKNGAVAGTTSRSLRLEALEMKLVPKGGNVQGRLDQIMNGQVTYDKNTVMKLGSRFTGTRSGAQCKGFAMNVFYICFKVTPGSTQAKPNNYKLAATSGMRLIGSSGSITASSAKSIFSGARPGDFVQIRRKHTGSHSAIVYSVSSDGVTFIEANMDGRNTVSKRYYTWANLSSSNAGMSVYTATSYSLK